MLKPCPVIIILPGKKEKTRMCREESLSHYFLCCFQDEVHRLFGGSGRMRRSTSSEEECDKVSMTFYSYFRTKNKNFIIMFDGKAVIPYDINYHYIFSMTLTLNNV